MPQTTPEINERKVIQMKTKQILKRLAVVFTAMLTLALGGTALTVAANNLLPPGQTSVSEFIEENVDTSNDEIASGITRTLYSINWTVNPNSSRTLTSAFDLDVDSTFTFNLTYTPASASVDFGLLTPTNVYRYAVGSNGVCKHTFRINEDGDHQIRIRNNSSSTVTITGRYATADFDYVFKSPKLAKKISQVYSSAANGHYGIDIVHSTQGEIANNFPVYAAHSGTVHVATESTSAGNYVVIIGDDGLTTRYLHLRDDPSVSVNDVVDAGDLLGYAGNTGESSGAHLHFDVNTYYALYGGGSSTSYVNGSTTVNPVQLFPEVTFTY
jgi:murein DD-endopeptidase MepM/ murein hydrolase activator NlpD